MEVSTRVKFRKTGSQPTQFMTEGNREVWKRGKKVGSNREFFTFNLAV
jgi:hypothetical protein